MFARQKRLTTNPLTSREGIRFDFNEIYIPLGLVARKQQEKYSENISPKEGSSLYEPEEKQEQRQKQEQEDTLEPEYKITKTFQNNEFFDQVLKRGKSPQSEGQKLAIIGEPGAGKITLLQKIADWVFENTERDIVVWVSLADLKKKKIEEYLLQNWLKSAFKIVHVTSELESALAEQFKRKRVWLLLDGVDEIAAESVNILATIAKQIDGWIAEARVIVTCRLNVWDTSRNALADFDVYRNLEFSYPEQVNKFISRWFAKEPKRSERLQKELEQAGRERIRDTVKNPLRLALLCRTWQRREGTLPSTKAALYKQFTEALYDWKQDIFPTKSAKRRELNQALGRLALRAIAQETSRFRILHHLVFEELGDADAEDSLLYLALQLGWINRVGIAAENPDENVYAFFHPTFQEYFAAIAIEDWHYLLNHDNRLHNPLLNPNPSLEFNQGKPIYRVFEPQWKEVILLWFGRENIAPKNKEKFLTTLFGFQDGCKGFYSYRSLFLAAACIAEFEASSLAVNIAEQLVRLAFFLKGREFYYKLIQEKASELLAESSHGAVVSTIVNFIQRTESEDIPIDVIKKLGEFGQSNEEAIQFLLNLIQTTKSSEIIRQAIKSLIKICSNNQTIITALLNLLQTTQNDYIIHEEALLILEKFKHNDKTIINTLLSLIQNIENSQYNFDGFEHSLLIKKAVEILVEIDADKETIVIALLNLLQTAQNSGFLKQAFMSLLEISSDPQTIITASLNLIQTTKSSDILEQVVISLLKIKSDPQTIITALLNLIQTTKSSDILEKAVKILIEIKSDPQTIITALLNLIQTTKSSDILEKAVKILIEIKSDPQTIITALLNPIQSSQDKNIRLTAIRIIEKNEYTNQISINALLNLIKTNKSSHTLDEVLRCIEKIGWNKINSEKETLIKALASQLEINSTDKNYIDNYLVKKVARKLEGIAVDNNTLRENVISEFLKLLKISKSNYISWQAIESLGRIGIGNQQVISALVKVIKITQDGDLRNQAAESLAIVGMNNSQAIADLSEMLEIVKTEDIYWLAVDILGRIGIGNQQAILTLERLIKTIENKPLCLQAAEKLWKIDPGNKEALITLKTLLPISYIKSIESRNAQEETINNSRPDFIFTKDHDKIFNENNSDSEDNQSGEITDASVFDENDENDEVIEEGDPRIGDKQLIANLVKLLNTTIDLNERKQHIKDLGNFGIGSQKATKALIDIIKNDYYQNEWHIASSSLQKILQGQLFSSVVYSLKTFLDDQIYHDDPGRHRICYEVIWHCAQNMPYPNFYKVWKDK